jgi:N utilization substance protein B
MNDLEAPTAPPRNRQRPLGPQRRGRVLTLQVLYEVDLTSHDWRESLQAHAEAVHASPQVIAFAETCLSGVLDDGLELDESIATHAPAWPLAQLAVVDRNVLRVALYELRAGSNVPPKVAINEAVELAKEFGGETSGRFVNGVLGSALEAREA